MHILLCRQQMLPGRLLRKDLLCEVSDMLHSMHEPQLRQVSAVK